MSKIIKQIKVHEEKIVNIEYEKLAIVEHDNHTQESFEVPEDNFINTPYGIFKWDERIGRPSGKYFVCYFKVGDRIG